MSSKNSKELQERLIVLLSLSAMAEYLHRQDPELPYLDMINESMMDLTFRLKGDGSQEMAREVLRFAAARQELLGGTS